MRSLTIISIIVLCLSCSKKEDENESLAPEPFISFVDLTPTEVENFKNSITLTIYYKDNNGDLGFEDPDEFALWVKDSRLDSADFYHVSPRAPLGNNIVVHGTLDIVLNSMFIIGNGTEEKVQLSVKIRDRNNNWSNIINTPSITISK